MNDLPAYERYPLFDYQKRYVKLFLEHYRAGVPLDCGKGKTRIMLDTAHRLKKINPDFKVLVISELNIIKFTWPDEIEKWQYPFSYQVLHGVPRRHWKDVDIMLLNNEYLSWSKREPHKPIITKELPSADMLIIDESSNFKNHSSNRFKKLKKDCFNYQRCYLLSANMLSKDFQNIWAQAYLIDGGTRLGKTITEFRQKYMKVKNVKYYTYTMISKDAEIAVLDKIKDVIRHFEEPTPSRIIYQNRVGEMSNIEKRKYNTFQRKGLTEIDNHPIQANNKPAKRMLLRGLASGVCSNENFGVIRFHDVKLDLLKQLLREVQGKNLLIAYNFNVELKMLKTFLNNLDLTFTVFKGGMKDKEKEIIKNDWNEERISILLAQPQAMAKGLNLQYGGHHICWFSPTESWLTYYQLNKRLDRADQKFDVLVHHLIVKGTIDEDIYKGLQQKEDADKFVNLSLYERPLM